MNEADRLSGGSRWKWTLWVVGLLALLWNLMGIMNFFMQMNPEMLSQMPESHRAIAESRPFWVTLAFGLSVLTGALGGLFLLLKKSAASPLFIISLLGAIVATVHAVVMGDALALFSAGEVVLAIAGPIILGIFLIWFAKRAKSLGWLSS